MGKRYKLGDIVAIPLPDNKFAYGMIHNDASIGIYDLISELMLIPEEIVSKPFTFFSGIFDTAITQGFWPKVGHVPFADKESSWPPPTFIQDVINPSKFRIYHKGEMREATEEEIQGLDEAVMRKPEHLIAEILRRLK
jgi:hypothetical protein